VPALSIERSIFRKFSKWLRNNFLNSQEDFSPKEILILESHKSDLLERIGNINRLSLRDKLQRIFYETPTSFILSEKTFADLKSKNIPNDMIEKLEGIKGQEINGKKGFLDLLEDTIGEEYTIKYQLLILKHVEIFGSLLMPILGNPRNMNEALREFFVHLIPTRNYLTHFSQDVTQQVFQDDELENAAVVCWGLLTFWIARHLGTDEDHAVDMALAAKNAMFLVSLQHRL
jgi:hypothetical protein